jgi:acyl carrier protein
MELKIVLPDERMENLRSVGDVLERLTEVLASNTPVHPAERLK